MGLSQKEFSKLLGMSQSGYSKYETTKNIPITSLVRLADVHDTSIDYLLGRTNKR